MRPRRALPLARVLLALVAGAAAGRAQDAKPDAGPDAAPDATPTAMPNAQPTVSFDTAVQLDSWMHGYYRQPRPELARSALQSLDRLARLEQHPSEFNPDSAFFALVLRRHPEQAEACVAEADLLGGGVRRLIWCALWISGRDDASRLIEASAGRATEESEQAFARKLLDRTPPVLEELQPAEPADLDLLWGAFFATGEPVYVQRVITVVGWYGERRDMNRFLTGGAAKWSLARQGQKHEVVLETCRQQLERAQDETLKELRDVVARAAQKDGPEAISKETKAIVAAQVEAGVWGGGR